MEGTENENKKTSKERKYENIGKETKIILKIIFPLITTNIIKQF